MFSFGHCKKIWRGGGSCPNFFGTCFTKYSVSYISTSKSCRVYTFWSFVLSYNCKIIKSTKIMTDGFQKFSGKRCFTPCQSHNEQRDGWADHRSLVSLAAGELEFTAPETTLFSLILPRSELLMAHCLSAFSNRMDVSFDSVQCNSGKQGWADHWPNNQSEQIGNRKCIKMGTTRFCIKSA